MSDFDLVIRNARAVTASDSFDCDIGIRAGRIAQLGLALPRGRQEIDAAGRTVTPGGVDAHCHLDQPMPPPTRMADDFDTGTRAAACGGTTTVIPFAMQMRGQSLADVVADYHERARPKAHIDYTFHLIVGDPTPQLLNEELPRLIAEGCTSVKIYLTYEGLKLDDYEVLEVLNVARREGALTMVHAENDACIRWLTEHFLKARKTHLRYHVLAHPAIGDREATFRAISLAEVIETPILICHVSAAGATEEIRRAKQRGLPVYGETCPQYLFLSAEDIDTPDLTGAMCVCTPPPRPRENQPEMWRGLLDGTLEVFSSDHSPWHYTDKIAEGPDTPFTRIPNGVPGIETRLPLLFSAAVNGGRMSLVQFAEVTSTTPARLYGLYPQKGAIAIGADADLALWDAQREVTIANAMLHHATDHTPYEGMTVRGWPVTTVSRGEIVWHEGEVRSTPGRGRFIAAARPFPQQSGLPPVLEA
jgi:dihydropyrimidinase